jgi:hypothetical protein
VGSLSPGYIPEKVPQIEYKVSISNGVYPGG